MYMYNLLRRQLGGWCGMPAKEASTCTLGAKNFSTVKTYY